MYLSVYFVNQMFQMSLRRAMHIAGWSTYLYYGYTTVLWYACIFVVAEVPPIAVSHIFISLVDLPVSYQ